MLHSHSTLCFLVPVNFNDFLLFFLNYIMRDITKLPHVESSRSCRRPICSRLNFDGVIYDETDADTDADICRHDDH